jgi:hypothetical protein
MATQGIDEQMVILERLWFAEDKVAVTARAEIANAEQSQDLARARAARRRLDEAEQHKTKIMREIEAAEDSLLD